MKRGARHLTGMRRRIALGLLGLGVVGVVILLMLVLPRSPEPFRPVDALSDPTLLTHGRSLYMQHCASCHGANLEGQPNWKRPLLTGGYPAPPHDASGHTWHHPDQLLFKIIKNGGQASAPPGLRSNMPAFKAVLSDGDIWAVLAYIKSRWPAEIQAQQAEITRSNP